MNRKRTGREAPPQLRRKRITTTGKSGSAAGTAGKACSATTSQAAVGKLRAIDKFRKLGRAAKAVSRPVANPALQTAKVTIRALKAELAEAQARIDELQAWADTDFLLDILNRRGFERELARSLAYIRRYGARGALIVLDVDRLKPINDAFGHAAGDAVLKGIVAVLMRQVRSSDVVGRLGGDEFGLLLWNLGEADAQAKAAALESMIDRLTFVFRGRSIAAGASAGVAMLDADRDPAAILEAADRAMYARKQLRRTAATDGALLRR